MGLTLEYLSRWWSLFYVIVNPFQRIDFIAKKIPFFHRVFFCLLLTLLLMSHVVARCCMVLESCNPLMYCFRRRARKQTSAVFIVAGPRTGSTVFHRALLQKQEKEDEKQSVRDVTGFQLKDWLFMHSFFVRLAIHVVEQVLPSKLSSWFALDTFCGKEMSNLLKRQHPMDWNAYEETEVWQLLFFLSGNFITHLFPCEAASTNAFTFQAYSPSSQIAIARELRRCMENLVLFRNNITNRASKHKRTANMTTVVLKSHGIFELQALSDVFPGAKFIVLQRSPLHSMVSYRQLRVNCFHALTLGLDLGSTAFAPLLELQTQLDSDYFKEEQRVLESMERIRSEEGVISGTWQSHPTWVLLYEHLVQDHGAKIFSRLANEAKVGEVHLRLPRRTHTARVARSPTKAKKESKSNKKVEEGDQDEPYYSRELVDVVLSFDWYKQWLEDFHKRPTPVTTPSAPPSF